MISIRSVLERRIGIPRGRRSKENGETVNSFYSDPCFNDEMIAARVLWELRRKPRELATEIPHLIARLNEIAERNKIESFKRDNR